MTRDEAVLELRLKAIGLRECAKPQPHDGPLERGRIEAWAGVADYLERLAGRIERDEPSISLTDLDLERLKGDW